MTISIIQGKSLFKKKSLPPRYLPIVLLCSILCSLLTQILLCSPNYEKRMNASHSVSASVIDIDSFVPLETGYYSESSSGLLTLSTPDYPISGVYLQFSDPLYLSYTLVLYYHWLENDSPKVDAIRTEFRDSKYYYIPLDNNVYTSIELHFHPNDDSYTDEFVSGISSLYLVDIPNIAPLIVENILYTNQEWSEFEQTFSSIRATETLFYFIIYFIFFFYFIKHWNYSKKYIPFVLVFFVMLFFFSSKSIRHDDYVLFLPQQEQYSILEYSLQRYQTWNSRFFIEIFPYFLVHSLPLWAVLTSFMSVALCYLTSEFFPPTTFWKNLLIVALFLSFPLNTFGEVGWVATTCNYLWVLSLSCYSFLIIAKDLRGEQSSKLFHCSTFISCLYASNQEQSCALLLGFYLVFLAYYLLKKKSVKTLLPYFGIILFNLGNHLFSPATQSRYDSIITSFSHFNNYSLLNKLELGYTNTLMNVMSVFPLLPLIVSSFVLFLAFLRTINNQDTISNNKIPSYLRPTLYLLFPLFVLCLFSPNFDLVYGLQKKFPAYSLLANDFTMGGTFALTPETGTFFPLLVVTFFLISLSISIFLSIKNKITAVFSLVLLCAGLASGVILGFSPSIFQFTTFRIFIFFGWAFALIAILLYEEILREGTRKQIALFHLGISLLCLSQTYTAIQLVINPQFF